MLNKAVMERWIAVLRSGEYRQGRDTLLDADGGYCCLGVLAAIQGARVEVMVQASIELKLDGNDYSAGLSEDIRNILANMNDGRGCDPRSFDHIAGYIQALVAEESDNGRG